MEEYIQSSSNGGSEWERERKLGRYIAVPVQENEGLIELPDSHRWADPPWQLGSMPERRMEEIEEDQPTRNKKFMVN
jgi:hypothetical protein